MEIISGKQLVNKLRSISDGVCKRLWVAVPFIGKWSDVRRILGRTWVDNGIVDVRLLTDISEYGGVSLDTFKCFKYRGTVKTIKGLHAKIYIVDNQVIVASANLTGTAFSKRYETGVLLSDEEAEAVVRLYADWWENVSEDVPLEWQPKRFPQRGNKELKPGSGLPVQCVLPPDPGDPIVKMAPKFRDYEEFRRCYRDFADIYAGIIRIWPQTHLFFETDTFLNFLFHHANGVPSKRFAKAKPRYLDISERKKEVEKYVVLFSRWIVDDADKNENSEWREKNHKIVKALLSKEKISSLNKAEVKQVLDTLNCMNSRLSNKVGCLRENTVQSICKAWENLLYGSAPLQTRMTECKNSLRFFGKSSVQELIGFHAPDEYPLRNTNSSAGLRFLGYDIAAY